MILRSFNFRAPIVAISIIALLLISCSDSGGGSSSSSNSFPTNNPDNGEVSFIQDQHISKADSRPTLDAIAGGLNPYSTLIDDQFFCYNWSDPEFSVPDSFISVSGNSYSTELGTGEIEPLLDNEDFDLIFRGGSLDGEAIQVSFSSFGQSFTISPGGRSAHCYQNGSATEYANIRFRLAELNTGAYNCRNVSNGKDTTLLLSDNGTYTLGVTQGSWNVTGGIEKNSSNVTFTGGALGGATLGYHEAVDSGYRWFDWVETNADGLFDNGQSVGPSTLNCWNFGPPLAYPVYGAQPAPRPTKETIPLSGRYVRSIEVSTTTDEYHDAEHFWFDPSGYVYRGYTPRVGLDCERTKPNGLAFCDTYVFDGENLVIYSALGNEVDSYSARANGTELKSLGSYSTIAASYLSQTNIAGLWSNFTWWNYGCVGGSCSNGYSDRGYAFNDQARFRYSTEGISTIGVSTIDGDGSAFAFGSTDLSSLGGFTIKGTTLTLGYDSGDYFRYFAVMMANGHMAIGDRVYRYKGR